MAVSTADLDVLICIRDDHETDGLRSTLESSSISVAACNADGDLDRFSPESLRCVILDESVLSGSQLTDLGQWLSSQPPWSDVPVIILRSQGAAFRDRLEELGRLNASLQQRLDLPAGEEASELRQDVHRLQSAFDSAAVGIVEMGPDGRFWAVNYRMCQIVGHSKDELEVMTTYDLTAPEDRLQTQSLIQQLRDGQLNTYSYEKRFLRRDGSRVWVHVTVSAIRDGQGRFLRSIGTVEDITDRRAAQETLDEVRHRMTGIVASAMDAIISIDANQRVVLFNRSAEDMFGVPVSEAIGSPLDRFIPERFRGAHREHVTHFGQTGQTSRRMGHMMPLSALRCDGTEFPIEASISQVQIGQEKLFTVILRDITMRVRAEEALRQSEERFRAVAELVPLILWTATPRGEFDYFNARLEQLTGVSVDQCLGRAWLELIHETDRAHVKEVWDCCVREGLGERVEFRLRQRDGSYRWHLTVANPLVDDQGRVLRWYGTSTDIDDIKAAQESLTQVADDLRRSNQDLEQFAYVASHDLQEPLRMVSGHLQLLKMRMKDKLDPVSIESMDYAVEGAVRMQEMVQDLLAYSRVGMRGADFHPSDTREAAQAAVRNLTASI